VKLSLSIRQRRYLMNVVALTLSLLAMVFGLYWLGWILWTLLEKGYSALSTQMFTQMTPPPGSEGGLLNAIWGSFLMTGIATLIGTPIGILAGIYLAEMESSGPIPWITRFLNQILLSAPSVIIGFFIYAALVTRVQHFSGWAGILALIIILVPVVMSSTENMLRLIPNSLREAAAALGAPHWKIIGFVTLRAARSGVATGVLLAVARISGETAPLLFTALNNQFWSSDLTKPIANLPTIIFQFAMSPYEDWHTLAWGGAILITGTVLIFNVTARILMKGGKGSST
jgi:phosphate transport system permease protein